MSTLTRSLCTTQLHTTQLHTPSMGGNVHLIAVAPDAPTGRHALDVAVDRLDQLDRRWSRFRPDSDLSRINRGRGRPVAVSPDAITLVRWCVEAWRRTGGLFDPTTVEALERLGYDCDFDRLDQAHLADRAVLRACARSPQPLPSPGCARVEVDAVGGTVRVPAGTRLDSGGIGKGLAADLVTAAMLSAGAVGACANLAGDVRARGRGPAESDGRWAIGVETTGEVVQLPDGGGAVATSSSLVRRWGPQLHHLVDPASGRSATSDVVEVTVLAREGAWADAVTKVALVPARHEVAVQALDRLDVAALLVLADGSLVPTDGWAALDRTGGGSQDQDSAVSFRPPSTVDQFRS